MNVRSDTMRASRWVVLLTMTALSFEATASPTKNGAGTPPGAPASASWSVSELEPGVFDLIVNGRPAGESIVLLRGDDILVPVADIRRAGLLGVQLDPELHDGVEYVPLGTVAAYVVDLTTLQIRIEAPASALGRSTIDLTPRAPEDMHRVNDLSAFFNYAPRLIDGQRFEGFGELGVSMGSALGLTSASHDPDRGPVRLMSQLIFDNRQRLQRATIGDRFPSSGPLGGSVLLGGIALASNFELDPYMLKAPTLGFTGNLTTPGTLDVYVNDALIRRIPVGAGQFEVKNLTPVTGEGTVRYVLRDAYGREQNVVSPYYMPSGVLMAGLSEYDYDLGFIRNAYGIESFDYGEPAFVGRHRYGFTNTITGGGRVELSQHRQSAGMDLTLAPGAGQIDIAAGSSMDDHDGPRLGAAGSMGFTYSSSSVALSTAMQVASPQYATLSLAAADDRDLVEYSAGVGLALSARLSLSNRLAYALRRDDGPLARGETALQAQLSREASLRLVQTASYAGQGIWRQGASVMLSLRLPYQHHFSASHSRSRSTGDRRGQRPPESTLRLSRSITGRTGVGYRFSGTQGQTAQLHGSVQARTTGGVVGASATRIDDSSHTLLEAAAGLAFVPKAGVFLSQPIDQSFAVIHIPGASRVRGYLNNQEVGTTDSNGYLFVPDLLPHYANRIRFESEDLPLDHRTGVDERLIAPPYRGAGVVGFEAEPVRLVRGRIRLSFGDGTFEPARYGDIRVTSEQGTYVSLLGVDGELEFDGLESGKWQAEVVSPAGRCTFKLDVPPMGDDLVRELGVVTCRAEKEKNQ